MLLFFLFAISTFILLVVVSTAFNLSGKEFSSLPIGLQVVTGSLLLPSLLFPFVFVYWLLEILKRKI